MTTTARLLLCLLLLAGCSGVGAAPAPQLDGRTFLSTGVTANGAPFPLIANTRVRLEFVDGRLVASAGCNTLGGQYRVQDGLLNVSDLATTDMGCDPERH